MFGIPIILSLCIVKHDLFIKHVAYANMVVAMHAGLSFSSCKLINQEKASDLTKDNLLWNEYTGTLFLQFQ